MRSSSSTSLAHVRGLGSVRLGSSPLLSQGSAQALSLLETAAEQLMVQRDFRAALDSCERGLDSMGSVPEQEDTSSNFRCSEVKVALCTIGVQALAELNQWRGVLPWILQYYGTPEKIPAKIMQMCILLYTKVDEPAVVLQAGGDWLRSPANQSLPGYGAVAELYLLHILVPLGRLGEAQALAESSTAFSEEQRQVAVDIIEHKRSSSQPQSPSQAQELEQKICRSAVSQRLDSTVRLLYRALFLVRKRFRAFPFQKTVLAAVLLYLLLIRVDPAVPSAFPWISNLLQMFRQMWDTMFAPYYRAAVTD
ncbi:peroxisome assembly protein 26 [Lepisosteus oculatus]|uniref:peroxisome assembly protein 26 n=1 Tax=Lepisosteus oculatus TaxID=7918 RepID=UPI003717CE83